MHKKTVVIIAPVILALGLVVVALPGHAAARLQRGFLATGTLQCQATGKVKFRPPLSRGAPTTTVMSVKARLSCSIGTTGNSGVTVTSGKLSARSAPFTASCTSTAIGSGTGTGDWSATGGRVEPTGITWSGGLASGTTSAVLDVPGSGAAGASGSYSPEGVELHIVSNPLVGGRCSKAVRGFAFTGAAGSYISVSGLNLIKHVIMITQENRSFDQYFGTFPGADGIPAGACVPDPATSTCVAPFHDSSDVTNGGPHGAPSATADINGGKMDGFIAQAEQAKSPTPLDVVGYKDQREIPNY